MRVLLILPMVLALSGCLGAREQLAKRDDADCQAYGAKPGSQEYFQCRMAKDRNNSAAEAATTARSQSALSELNQTIRAPQIDYSTPPMQRVGPVTTNCNRIGNQTTCTTQ